MLVIALIAWLPLLLLTALGPSGGAAGRLSFFRDVEVLPVDPSEPWGASVLAIGDNLVMPASFPRTRPKLEARGFTVVPVDLSELQKAEGGPTCLSIVFDASDA